VTNLTRISCACGPRTPTIPRNFQPVSMCIKGNGIGPGQNAFCASRSITEESLPIEYSITGFAAVAATSRMISIDSDSSSEKMAPFILQISTRYRNLYRGWVVIALAYFNVDPENAIFPFIPQRPYQIEFSS